MTYDIAWCAQHDCPDSMCDEYVHGEPGLPRRVPAPLCGEMVSMHDRDSTNDVPCRLPRGHAGHCSPGDVVIVRGSRGCDKTEDARRLLYVALGHVTDWKQIHYSVSNGGTNFLYQCPQCGAAVADGVLHKNWHVNQLN